MPQIDLKTHQAFRKELHQHPELSGQEKETAKRIKKALENYSPDQIIENVGGYGLLAIYDSGHEGPNIAIRGDIDALPIEESNDFAHKSKNDGVAHKCGHDGHTTILIALAEMLQQQKPKKGKVCLLFQAAEETGEGALAMVNDDKFKDFQADYIFGLHNLPGIEMHKIITSKSHFAAASAGLIVKLKGATAHAAEPEKAKSPSLAIAHLLKSIATIHEHNKFKSMAFATIIHCQIGEIAFGTTPGYGELRATLRAYEDDDLQQMKSMVEKDIKQTAEEHELKCDIAYTEEFPATINDAELTEIIQKAAAHLDYSQKELEEAFRWSEDFGHFKDFSKIGFFGLGSGGDTPNLHHEAYDFPDEIIESGAKMFFEIIQTLQDK